MMNTSDIEQLEECLRQAMLTSDVSALDRLLSERLLFVTPDGSRINKAGDLRAHQSGLIRVSSLVPFERQIEQFGPVSIVNVEMEMAGTLAGSAVSEFSLSGRHRVMRATPRSMTRSK